MLYGIRVKKSYEHQPCDISKNEPIDSFKTRNDVLLIYFDTQNNSKDEQKNFFVESEKWDSDFFLEKYRQ